jgi:hypothetical protein
MYQEMIGLNDDVTYEVDDVTYEVDDVTYVPRNDRVKR